MPTRERIDAQRERLAYEAARIVLEQGLDDFDRARRKAAERIGVQDRRHWPTNEAVQDAVLAQRRLFMGGADEDELRDLRVAALQAMEQLDAFAPRLIGGALSGALGSGSGIELLLFADRAEDVIFTLLDLRIPWRGAERTLRYPDGLRCAHPAFRFVAGDIHVELIVLPRRALRNPPLDPVTERVQRGADREEVARLVAFGG
ncbi:glutathione S-transferase family protein [Thiocapsa marina]|uniref:Nucleotidyltransferase n=1 Tax=Thiocapsa marina 5811 TaxID=768671 RepID=F9UC86_9GAMM|nr:hypothetical protein [Thiocapsa marina]EGV17999.1 hypothetical protein ThimaDRAFT_2538 [Thiocapsa marina 5811]